MNIKITAYLIFILPPLILYSIVISSVTSTSVNSNVNVCSSPSYTSSYAQGTDQRVGRASQDGKDRRRTEEDRRSASERQADCTRFLQIHHSRRRHHQGCLRHEPSPHLRQGYRALHRSLILALKDPRNLRGSFY